MCVVCQRKLFVAVQNEKTASGAGYMHSFYKSINEIAYSMVFIVGCLVISEVFGYLTIYLHQQA